MTQCRPLAYLPSLTPTSLNRLQMLCCCSNSWIAASCSLWASVSLGLFNSRPARKTRIEKKKITAWKGCFKTFLLFSCTMLTVQLSNSPRRLDRVLFWATDSHVALRNISLSLSAHKTPSQNLHSIIAGKINRLKSPFFSFYSRQNLCFGSSFPPCFTRLPLFSLIGPDCSQSDPSNCGPNRKYAGVSL